MTPKKKFLRRRKKVSHRLIVCGRLIFLSLFAKNNNATFVLRDHVSKIIFWQKKETYILVCSSVGTLIASSPNNMAVCENASMSRNI